ncbi:hypothetical protein VFPPC_11504 [Pochonia chlamydosporia 170]|uniref:Uncharacterized protein n=1 Tax=Pochonia chlamydosporia 170 TaxID=1380566 RepID=A0A179F0S9_METCM|nr:hypothetical protein VFPPC_11504 [Pochonia chlamydosporia 170]OAQ59008.1 hypothetical protein VFPPC_11504 [Pochonia chlamydosporia 170]
MPAVAPALAPTRCSICERAVSGTRLAAWLTIQQIIGVKLTARVSRSAHEHAGVHVRDAPRGGRHAYPGAGHVDFARDIDGCILPSCEFSPGIFDQPMLAEPSPTVNQGRPAARNTIFHANSDRVVAFVEGVGDFWAASTHGDGLIAIGHKVPKDQYHWDFSLIREGKGIGPVVTDPDVAVANVYILSLTGHANARHVLAISFGKAKSRLTAVEMAAVNTTHARTKQDTSIWADGHSWVFEYTVIYIEDNAAAQAEDSDVVKTEPNITSLSMVDRFRFAPASRYEDTKNMFRKEAWEYM